MEKKREGALKDQTGSFKKPCEKVKIEIKIKLSEYLSFLDRFSIQHILIVNVFMSLQRVVKLT